MRLKDVFAIVKATLSAWSDDYAASMGAALAYYSIFSLAPLLIIVIAVAGYFFGPQAARHEILEQLAWLVGPDGAAAVESLLISVAKPEHSVIAAGLSIVLLIIGATSVFAELQNDLDRIWHAATPDRGGWFSLLRSRLLSFGMILAIAFLLMVSLIASAAISALGKSWGALFPGWEAIAEVVNFLTSFALITVLFAMIYKIMPRVKIQWRDVWSGALVTSLLFTIGKSLIGFYIGRSSIASTFGAAASLVAILVWVYYSAQIFLLGAEFTRIYAHAAGSRRRKEGRVGRSEAAVDSKRWPPAIDELRRRR